MTDGAGNASGHPPRRAVGMQRLMQGRGAPVDVSVNGRAVPAYAGETLHTVLMATHGYVRQSDFGDGQRGGFCLMGACQDCWVSLRDGRRVRACTTYAAPGQNVVLEETD